MGMFKRATRSQAKLRMALIGPSGSGKTYTGLTIADALGGPIAVIDTEHGSAAKYAGEFEFDSLNLENFDPREYIKAIRAASAEGYNVLIIDSLSHAWVGSGGALEIKDKAAAKKGGNSFAAWADVTPLQNQLFDTIIRANCHVIATMRAKQEYILQPDATGRMTPKKVGLGAVQRDGSEYEFDIVGQMDIDHKLIIDKSRFRGIDGEVITRPERSFGERIASWLSEGEPAREPEPASAPVAVINPNPVDPSFAAKVAEADRPAIDRTRSPVDYAAMAADNAVEAAASDDSGDAIGGRVMAELLAVRDAAVKAGKMTAGQWKKALDKRGVRHEGELTKGQGREIIAKVRSILDAFGFEPDANGTSVDPTIPHAQTGGTNDSTESNGVDAFPPSVGSATQEGGDGVSPVTRGHGDSPSVPPAVDPPPLGGRDAEGDHNDNDPDMAAEIAAEEDGLASLPAPDATRPETKPKPPKKSKAATSAAAK